MNNFLAINGKKIKITNLDKVLYPKRGFTKAQVIDYYIKISPILLPHLVNRPLTLKRYPEGVTRNAFYEKQCPSFRPPWITTVSIWSKKKKLSVPYCLINNAATLIWVANLANLELHIPLAKVPNLQSPTMIVFDLDPGPPFTVFECAQAAVLIKELLYKYHFDCFPKTSGSKGLQLYVPLNVPTNYEITKAFAKSIAEQLEKDHPKLILSKMSKKLRMRKIFIDWSQNVEHKTTICAYSLRGQVTPTVSTPIKWEEILQALKKQDASQLIFESDAVLKRVNRYGDLFEPLLKLKQNFPIQPPSYSK